MGKYILVTAVIFGALILAFGVGNAAGWAAHIEHVKSQGCVSPADVSAERGDGGE